MKTQVQKKTSQQSIKEGNSRLIFNTLVDYQPISRAGIKKLPNSRQRQYLPLLKNLLRTDLSKSADLPTLLMSEERAFCLLFATKVLIF
jgi:hypothetical protein